MTMKTVIYSTQTSGFEAGAEYRNPRFFRAPLGKPDLVKVVGEWPEVVKAYRAIGVEVEADERVEPAADLNLTRAGIGKMKQAELLELLAAHGVDPEVTAGKTVPDLRTMLIATVFIEG